MQKTQVLQIESWQQQKRNRQFMNSVLYHLGVGLLGLVMLYPLFWLFSSSFKPADEIWTTVNSLIPSEIRLENYANGWKGFGGISFATFYKNSFIYAGV